MTTVGRGQHSLRFGRSLKLEGRVADPNPREFTTSVVEDSKIEGAETRRLGEHVDPGDFPLLDLQGESPQQPAAEFHMVREWAKRRPHRSQEFLSEL